MGVQHRDDESPNYDILINFLLDRSGSMADSEKAVREHYNAYIKSQAKLPGKARVSLSIFDTIYDEVYSNLPINEVPLLDHRTYFARGGTALLDGLGRLIKTIDAIPNKPSKVVVVVNTDGEENSSREFTLTQVKELVTERQENHDWQFVFVGAGIDAFHGGVSLGMRGHGTFAVAAGPMGQSMGYNHLNTVTSSYRSGAMPTMDMANPDPVPVQPKKKKSSSANTR